MPIDGTNSQLGRFLDYDGSGGWTAFKNSVHVRCGASLLWFTFSAFQVTNGKLQFFWDGKEITKANGFTLYPIIVDATDLTLENFDYYAQDNTSGAEVNGFQAVAMLPVTNLGGHTFEMIFTPLGSGTSGANLATFQFFSESTYANCQDNKMCLSLLSSDDEEHAALRNRNEVQHSCLLESNPSSSSACGKWRTCLNDDAETDLLVLYQAAGVGTENSSALLQQERTGLSSGLSLSTTEGKADRADDVACVDPGTADVLAWTCDCLDGMKTICEERSLDTNSSYTTLTACMHDLFCDHANVCTSWVAENCNGVALISRAGLRSDNELTDADFDDLDGSASAKTCV